MKLFLASLLVLGFGLNVNNAHAYKIISMKTLSKKWCDKQGGTVVNHQFSNGATKGCKIPSFGASVSLKCLQKKCKRFNKDNKKVNKCFQKMARKCSIKGSKGKKINIPKPKRG